MRPCSVLFFFFFSTTLPLLAQEEIIDIVSEKTLVLADDTTGIQVVLIGTSDTLTVEKLRKTELGIRFPEHVQQEIRSFIYNLRLAPGIKPLNPFLEWELNVEARFEHADGAVQVVDGFFYQPYEYYRNTWQLAHTDYPMRIRFAAPEAGTWQCHVQVSIRGKMAYSASFPLKVEDSGAPGFVAVHPNHRNFQRDGKMIFPIGQNFAAPEDSVRMYHALKPGFGPNETTMATDPRTWKRYRQYVENFADSGGQYIRTIQTPWASLIEFEQRGNYFKRLHYAWEQDQLLALCEEKNVLVLYNLLIQEPFMNFGDYWFSDWDWDRYDYDGNHHPEELYPVYAYNDRPGEKQPHEMFLNDEDLRYHEQRIRYYIARYGYSTAIYGFELLSEPYHLDQYWKNGPNNEPFLHPEHPLHDTVKLALENYHNRMSDYIKNKLGHTDHLIAVNVTNASWKPHGNGIFDMSIKSPNIDFVGINPYATLPNRFLMSKSQRNGHMQVDEGENSYYAMIHDYWQLCDKPIMISEGGQDEAVLLCSDFSGSSIDNKALGFLGFAGYNLWTGFRKHEFFIWEKTIATSQFFQEHVLPVLENGNGNWLQGRQATALHRRDKTPGRELQYYISEDQTLAVGYVYNRHYNFFTTASNEECAQARFTEDQKDGYPEMYPLNEKSSVKWNDGSRRSRLDVEGLLSGTRYTIRWYGFQDNTVRKVESVKSRRNGTLVLEYPELTVEGEDANPVYWFTLEPEG